MVLEEAITSAQKMISDWEVAKENLEKKLSGLNAATGNTEQIIREQGLACKEGLLKLHALIPEALGTFATDSYENSKKHIYSYRYKIYDNFEIWAFDSKEIRLRDNVRSDITYVNLSGNWEEFSTHKLCLISQCYEELIQWQLFFISEFIKGNTNILNKKISEAERDLNFITNICGIKQDETWEKYILYLAEWTVTHSDKSNSGSSPQSYTEWRKENGLCE